MTGTIFARAGNLVRLGAITLLCLGAMSQANTALADCSDPAGIAGDQIYNSSHDIMQFCNGTDWIAMGSTSTDSDTLADLTCTNNQIAQWNGSAWICSDGTEDTLSSLTCAADQVAKWDGSEWICADGGGAGVCETPVAPLANELDAFDTPGSASASWGDGTYIYVADGDSGGIRAYSFDGSTFTEEGSFDTPGAAIDIWGDGTYIYLADNASGLRAYTFDGTTFTEEGSVDPGNVQGVWGDGTYIFATNSTGGNIKAYTFNGTTFTEEGSANSLDVPRDVWGDGTYIYTSEDMAGGVNAYSFNGSTFTRIDYVNISDGILAAYGIYADESYVYAAGYGGGIGALSFDGTDLVMVEMFATPGAVVNSWGDGTYIYVSQTNSGIYAYTFDGTSFAEVGHYDTPGSANHVWGDGTYIYVADGASGIRAYAIGGCADNSLGDHAATKDLDLNGYDILDGGAINAASFVGDGSNLTGIDDTLADLNCTENQIAKWSGSAWSCAADANDGSGESGGDWSWVNAMQVKLTAGDAASYDYFGWSVAVDGDTAIIGAKEDDDGGNRSGSAYIFTRSGSTWTLQDKIIAGDAANYDEFGTSVALDGDTAIIGASLNDDAGSSSGSAYIFTRSGSTWTQQAKITASDAASGDEFGGSVALDGDTVIVGARWHDGPGSNFGAAYVFTRSGSTWTQQQKLTTSDPADNDYLGYSVALDGDTAIIGAPYDDDGGSASGSAYIYTRSGSTWTQAAKISADDAAASDYFGRSVALDGGTAIVGADGDDDGGSAYIFTGSGSTWTQAAKITADDAADNDNFGESVVLEGGTIIVGADGDDDAGSGSGAAYIFTGSGSTWTQAAKITANDAVDGESFGAVVAIGSNTAIVAAPYDDNDGYYVSGSAYIFDLTSGIGSSPNSIGGLTCSDGETLQYNEGAESWECAAGGGSDNLGDHTATTDLDLDSNDILNGGTINATAFVGDGSALTGVSGSDNLGDHTATQDLDMAGNDILGVNGIVLQAINGDPPLGSGGSETDPQVNTLTNGKWCSSDGSVINCTQDAPVSTIADGSITTAKLADGAVTGTKIAATTITGINLADGAVTGTKIAAASITGSNIANTTITVGKISATGTASSTTFLRGDGQWVAAGADNLGNHTATTALNMSGNNITSAGNVTAVAYLHSSDRNLKEQIMDITDPFALLNAVHGKHYVWKKNGVSAYGVIAQDVELVMPEAVSTDSETGMKAVEYDQLIAPLIEAVKLLKRENDALRADVEALKAKE